MGTPPCKPVLARRENDVGENFKRVKQALENDVWLKKAVERITGLEVPVPQSRVKVPAFYLPVVESCETFVVHVMKHLLNAQKVSRAGLKLPPIRSNRTFLR